ncbi:hypothetical protein BDB00DRAFT_753271, partial [Zychaea mexicana]|uniref:uncharacterized protein n=1 Tax=Zychaea mexicana TaxID=64656 RepID=UPI0022FE31AC
KVGLDHIKSMFGVLCILADIGDMYKFESFENMSKVHGHIIRAHGRKLQHWVLYSLRKFTYLFMKLSSVDCLVLFKKKTDKILPFIYFFIDYIISAT